MVVPLPGVWSYVKSGADWIGRFATDGSKAAADYFDPSKIAERTKEQAEALIRGGTPSPVTPEPSTIPDILPDELNPLKNLGKYAKYAAIGGAALIGVLLLRRR